MDRDQRRATVRFKLALGPLTTFGKTEILGLDRIGESTVRSRLAWEEGDPFDPDLVEKTEGLLFGGEGRLDDQPQRPRPARRRLAGQGSARGQVEGR